MSECQRDCAANCRAEAYPFDGHRWAGAVWCGLCHEAQYGHETERSAKAWARRRLAALCVAPGAEVPPPASPPAVVAGVQS